MLKTNFIKIILILIGLLIAGPALATVCNVLQGCTGISSYSAGDILYANATNTLTILNCSDTEIVKWTGGLPACAADASGSASGQWSTSTGMIYYNSGDVVIGDTATATAPFWFNYTTDILTIDDLTLSNFDGLLVASSGVVATTTNNTTNWDSAYTIVNASSSNWDATYSMVNASSSNWDTAFSWGDWSGQGFLTSVAYSDLTGYPADVITSGTGIDWNASTTLNFNSSGLTWAGNALTNDLIASSTEFLVDTDTTYVSSDFTHDDLTGFVANEHINWTADQGATNIHAGNYTDTDTHLTREQVEDYAGLMVATTTGTHTRISITYDDANGNMDFVVDDMNDDVPDAGDFGAATDLDANGALNTGCVADNEIDYANVTLADFDYQTAWRVFYSNTDGDVTELALGATSTVLTSNGLVSAPTWTAAGVGDFLADGSVPMTADFNLDGNNIDNGGVIFLKEQADADADIAGQGQIWVNTATPNELWFTDDAGTDVQLGTAGSTPTDITVADESTATTTYIGYFTSATGDLGPKTGSNLTFNSATGILTATGFAGDVTGALTGNADTATALAANGANATSGWAIIGVDALGAYEGGFDAWTEAENTAAGYISATLTQAEVEDYAGGLWTGNTETLITVTYQAGDNTLDAVVNDDLHAYDWSSVIDADITNTLTASIVSDADKGDITISGGTWTLDTGSVSDNEIDYANVTLADFDYQTNWRMFYSNGSGDVTELAFATSTYVLTSNGAAAAPTFTAPAGAGDITQVFDCATGDCNTMTVGTSEYLTYGAGYIDANRFAGVTTVDATEFGYLNGVSAAIQTGADLVNDDIASCANVNACTLTANAITDNLIIEADLNADEAPADNDILTFDVTGANFSWQTPAELSLQTGTDLTNDSVQASELTLDYGAFTCNGTTCTLDTSYQPILTNSAGLLAALSDETGTGVAVFGTSPTFTTGVTVPDNSISAAELNEGDNFAFTGTTVSLSGVTNFTVPAVADAAGEIAIDTTNDDQFIYYGDEANVITAYYEKCFTDMSATTTHDNIGLWAPHRAITITDLYCWVDAATSTAITISDGTNALEEVVCTVAGAADDGTIANGAFTANEKMEYDTGAMVGSPTRVTMCITYKITAD